ncbi:MAG: CoA transferase [Alphaproteobacteria bacterium]|nr:CoA transferase [Alphaproteobacteria bacterium]MCB9929712.1 CoA transferase [Alphaproteobacteria bacterium]
MTASGTPPFQGLRVLDFSRVIAGPACTQTLADFGADVIKIENPAGGDDTRNMAGPSHGGESHFFLAFNRGKRSLALDMSKAAARDIVCALAAQSDVAIQNFRPGVAERLGIDYAALAAVNPRLIYVSISAYGGQGPFSDRPGFDPVLQAEAGMMAMNGPIEGPPMRHPLSIIDTFTSLHATTAIATALYARTETGKGQHVELALFDAAVAATSNAAQHYLTGGTMLARAGNAHPTAAPVNVLTARDGPVYLALGNQRLWEQLCRLIERPDLAEDPRFATMAARREHRDALYAALDAVFGAEPRAYWAEKLRSLPVGPVLTVAESLDGEIVAAREMVRTVDHPGGPMRQLGSPYHFSDTPVDDRHRAPLLGEHTDEVLGTLCGLDVERIAELRAMGVVA